MIGGILFGIGFILIGELQFHIRTRNKNPDLVHFTPYNRPTMANPHYARGMWWLLGIIAFVVGFTL